ncbi:vicilin-like seed storage protein At2g18540 [Malus sylvestris]|uniref:vicilin-like seed storage protein At2g18540 n=1 Tax=Malus sylvestris TaxID=3752 RepID=UPI0021AC1937|nr:vicilin-like seed storage protein At2g18540 [Malus sylvestris]
MLKKAHIFFFFLLSVAVSFHAANALKNECECGSDGGGGAPAGSLVNINQRRSLVSTEYGEVWSVDVNDGHGRPYHIQFITLEPDSLFLPVLLHADMVFYVNTGSGRLSWTDDDEIRRVDIKRGDLYRLDPGTVFYVQSNLETERPKLRINAIFASNSDDDLYDPAVGAYSSIRDIVRGFDPKLLRSAFKVSEEVIESIVNGTDQSAIVHAIPTKKETFWDLEARFLKTFLLGNDGIAFNSKKKTTTYNIFDEEPDFENCNGWSLTVNKKTSNLLKGSNIGLFMVNLTKGSMMGPHWNPRATEIAIVLQGQGMVRVVCSSTAVKKSECRNMRFRVHEGDVFAVPRFHPMAQMSFNNNSLVFMGFSTTEKKNNPQFLAGKYSVLQTLDKQVLAASFNVTNTTIDQLLSVQPESFIIDCTSCAEEEEKVMLEEIKKEREEEEAKKREEEEARKREQEKQERKREDEEAKKREEEERETQEEERKREEEARKREEEEATREREEQAARERGEQTVREREEQAAREREEQVAKQQEEQAPKEQEEQEAAREREEREAAREREEEGRQQEKEGRQGDDERRQQEKRERERRQQEEWKRREEDERREREEAQRQQEEGQGRGEQTEQEGGGGGFDAEEGRRYLSVLKI